MRVGVAMSGGVDSSTVAALLVRQGHEVVGLSLRLYDARGTTASAGGRCCGPRDLEDARRCAAHLRMAHYVLNYQERFHRAVIDDFVSEYSHGRTPNPCVRCNERVKFGPLLARARALGCEFLATGHYAQLSGEGDDIALRRAVDREKDQSYFLFPVPRDVLRFLRFPLGSLSKADVRSIARHEGLPVAEKAESMEICFVPDGDHVGFVERRVEMREGDLETEAGDRLGRHRGVHRFTVGQRAGVGGGARRYVVRIDAASGKVIVGSREAAGSSRLQVKDVRWLIERPESRLSALVQVRHRAQPTRAAVAPRCGAAEVELETPVVAAPGQAAVFYDRDRVLGGGWIA